MIPIFPILCGHPHKAPDPILPEGLNLGLTGRPEQSSFLAVSYY